MTGLQHLELACQSLKLADSMEPGALQGLFAGSTQLRHLKLQFAAGRLDAAMLAWLSKLQHLTQLQVNRCTKPATAPAAAFEALTATSQLVPLT